jgi:hypothetical protein
MLDSSLARCNAVRRIFQHFHTRAFHPLICLHATFRNPINGFLWKLEKGEGGGYSRLYFKLYYGCLLPHPLQSANFSTIQGYVYVGNLNSDSVVQSRKITENKWKNIPLYLKFPKCLFFGLPTNIMCVWKALSVLRLGYCINTRGWNSGGVYWFVTVLKTPRLQVNRSSPSSVRVKIHCYLHIHLKFPLT